MQRLLVISADTHASAPLDQIAGYIESPAREFMDELVRENWNFCDLAVKPTRPSPETLEQFDRRHLVRRGGEYGAAHPKVRLEQMDAEGVAAEIVHPHTQINWGPFFIGKAPEVRAAGVRCYHRWLADFVDACDRRLFGVGDPGPCLDMDATLAELAWVREHGFVSVAAPGSLPSPNLPALYDEHFDPFWSACEDLGLVISVHAGWAGTGGTTLDTLDLVDMSNLRRDADENGALNCDEATDQMQERGSAMRLGLQQPRRVMWLLMAGGVLDRHPRLKIALTEIRADWVPQTLEHLAARFAEMTLPCKLSPREYWERHFLVVPSSIHRAEVAMRHDIGVGQLGFGTDFPHWEGVWPDTRDWLHDAFGAIPEEELRAILGGNAASFYGLPVGRLNEIAARIGPTVGDVLGGTTVDEELVQYFHRRSGYLRPPDPVYPEEIDIALQPDLRPLVGSSS